MDVVVVGGFNIVMFVSLYLYWCKFYGLIGKLVLGCFVKVEGEIFVVSDVFVVFDVLIV